MQERERQANRRKFFEESLESLWKGLDFFKDFGYNGKDVYGPLAQLVRAPGS